MMQMNRKALINQFLVHLKAQYPRFAKKEPERKKLVFKDQFVQRLWEGYQLCFDNLFQPQPLEVEPTVTLSQEVETELYIPHRSGIEQDQNVDPEEKNIRFLNPNELTTVIINSTVSIIYRNNKDINDQWCLSTAFFGLYEAVEVLNEMYIKRTINLDKWEPYKKPPKQYFLVPNSSNRKTHIWGDKDTLCRGWLNKAMTPKKYKLSDSVKLGETIFCLNCINSISMTNLKAKLKFDNEHKLLEINSK